MTEISARTALHVLVGRPEGRGTSLQSLLEQRGLRVSNVPLLHLSPRRAKRPEGMLPDVLVFVSVAAVEYGVPILDQQAAGWRTRMCYAVGPATLQALVKQGIDAHMPRHGSNSEALLAEPALQNAGCLWVVRGKDGRDLLEQTLSSWGCDVRIVDVYERALPQTSVAIIRELLLRDPPQLVILTSVQAAENWRVCADHAWNQPVLLLVSARMRQEIQGWGKVQLCLSQGASDEALLDAVKTWQMQVGRVG